MSDESCEAGYREGGNSLIADIAIQFSDFAGTMDDLLEFFRRVTGDPELEWPDKGPGAGGDDVWVVIDEDRHADVKTLPFSTEERAVEYARKVAGDMALPEGTSPDDVEHFPGEQELDPADRDDGVVLWLVYSIEGDQVRVVKRTMDAGPGDD